MEEHVAKYVSEYWRIAEGATPVIAQAQELLAQANLESAVYYSHRRGTRIYS